MQKSVKLIKALSLVDEYRLIINNIMNDDFEYRKSQLDHMSIDSSFRCHQLNRNHMISKCDGCLFKQQSDSDICIKYSMDKPSLIINQSTIDKMKEILEQLKVLRNEKY